MFLGDGMGITTITAMRIYKGQKHNRTGEDELLVFDEFPFVSLSKTYGVDRQTSDSANTATAYLCGVKANYGTIGVDGRVQYQNCSSSLDKTSHVSSILQWAQEEGKWTGVVTTTRVTHATPAGTYAHTASRDWESATPDPQCKDIADQLVNELPGKDIRVILGGGIRHFIPFTEKDADGMNGFRTDSRNLINEWKDDKTTRNAKWKTAFDKKNLRDLKAEEVDYFLGLFHSDHLPYVADRPALNKEYPSLAEMTEAAIKVLSRSPNGFFLLVEGGSIDLAHHMNFALKALEEGYEFDKAIQTALRLTNQEDTLIVVTADHSHTFTVGGDYPMRGNNILGIGGVSDVDNKTFTTLGYHNGPGYKPDARSRNLTEEEAIKKDFQQDSAFPMQYETHGAEDVAVYAKGPMAHLFHGVHEQSYIPYVMGYASCIGPNQDLCSSAWSYLITDQWTAFLRFATVGLTTYVFNLQSLH
ncbi:alkaline phosphatase, tissue-nonspecific isozyme-like [Stegodyphus dumicola]|uniref:alkaline phosphatase, tissue-nonspecific isozyme-like n=1 Tax=Stegodyphus dumicola TaxID=202533 RepID=UPI0015AC8677|nr:alkaline phosphatase, tissue-nonspecific isozyme-like [Stegodyphus dumicola]